MRELSYSQSYTQNPYQMNSTTEDGMHCSNCFIRERIYIYIYINISHKNIIHKHDAYKYVNFHES